MWPFEKKSDGAPVQTEPPTPVYFDAEFAIEYINVFSIERDMKNPEVTIVCHWVLASPDPVQEFHLRCSPEKHQEFVDRLRAKLRSQSVSPFVSS